MSSIWAALVPESKKTVSHHPLSTGLVLCVNGFLSQVDKYLKEILDDLVMNLNSNLWRVRQSR